MNRIKKTIWLDITMIVITCIMIIGYKVVNKPKAASGDANTVIIEGNRKGFSTLGLDDFTCTGLTWDGNSNSYWIGDYGAKKANDTPLPRVVQVDKNLSKIEKIIELSDLLDEKDNLQGIAYDEHNDSLWLAVGDTCKNITKDGKLISEFNLEKYSKYRSNGICVDGHTLWVLCYSKYMLHYDKSGNLLKEYKFNFKDQDMLFNNDKELLVTIGADYHGESNYVVSFDKETGSTAVRYQIKGAYAVEGITVVDGKMYILNDGLYHEAKIKESYFAIYDLK